MKTMDFNTGREYTTEGQKITASVIREDKDEFLGTIYQVRFVDHSRGIDGYVTVWDWSQDAIMNEYDNNRYYYELPPVGSL
jgi:hypothetical protein